MTFTQVKLHPKNMYKSIFFLFFYLAWPTCECSDSSLVESLTPCNKDDDKCNLALQNDILHYLAQYGDEKNNISRVDPFDVKDIGSSFILDFLRITMTEGQVKGLGNCSYTLYDMNYETGNGILNLLCEEKLYLEGFFTVRTVLDPLLGKPVICGNGYMTSEIEKLKINFAVKLRTEERSDSKKYMLLDKTMRKFDFKDIKVTVSDVKLGILDITTAVNILIRALGKGIKVFVAGFMEKAMEIYCEICKTIYGSAPAENFVKDL